MARWRTSRVTCFLPVGLEDGKFGQRFGQRRFVPVASRAWKVRGRVPVVPRIAAFERGTRPRVQIEKVPIVLYRRRRVWGAGYDWTRAGARASRVDPRTGAGGGSGGCARHRDRSADSGGRHGDGRRRRASRMGRCRMGFSRWLTLRSTSFRVRPCVRLRFCDRPLHVASSTNQSRAWHF